MAKNPDYFAQIRARGICTICRQPMPDTDLQLAHSLCNGLVAAGASHREIRALPDADARWAEYQRRRAETRIRRSRTELQHALRVG